ncbi:MAG: type II secretion system protein J [Phycisphaerales bacterium]
MYNVRLHRRGGAASRRARRGFNLVELLMALSISSILLTATMVAMDASFNAYQRTTESASTQTIGRLTMHRLQTMIRSGTDFEPRPATPLITQIESNFLEITDAGGDTVRIEWRSDEEALYYIAGGQENILMEGVLEQLDPDSGDPVPPFLLDYERGQDLYRVTIDLAIRPDDNMDVTLDGDFAEVIRLVASAMPRTSAYDRD